MTGGHLHLWDVGHQVKGRVLKGSAMKDDTRRHPFRDSEQDRHTAEAVPDTPKTRAPAYRLAFTDSDFMLREELRPVRLQL